MSHPLFHVGEECYVDVGQRVKCLVVGNRRMRPMYDQFGRHVGDTLAYRVVLDDEVDHICVAEGRLSKRWERSDWGWLRNSWRPKREAR